MPPLSPSDLKLHQEALRAAHELSWAPYSKFRVGAALLLDDGSIIVGANQENAAYPLCLCAERVALAAASVLPLNHMGGRVKIIRLLVTSPDSQSVITPCGACRQVMAEISKRQGLDIQVVMTGSTSSESAVSTAAELLPLAFTHAE